MLHRLRFIIALPLIVTLLLAACGGAEEATSTPSGGGSVDPTATAGPDPTATPGTIDLAGTQWALSSLKGEEIPPDVVITLAFEDGQAGGSGGCNEYGGAYTASETGEVSITNLHNTDMACTEPEDVMELESSYLEALGEATGYNATDERLELANADGDTMLVFEPDTRSELDGTSWLMIELDGQYPVTDTHITISFEDGGITGNAGCNDYFASYDASDGDLSITDLAIQEMGCDEPAGVMEQEQAYVDLLLRVTSYRFNAPNSWMEVMDESGEVLIIFANREEPNGAGFLDGTDWVLTHIDGQEVAPDPPATIMFRSVQYTGEYGCLVYSGRFNTTSTGQIIDMPVYPSEYVCEGVTVPPDLADTYMAELDRVTQYRLTDGRLDLLDEIGKIVLTYRPGLTSQGELDGTEWELFELNGSPLIPETEITLSFRNLEASGYSGCNWYGGDYTIVDEGVISIPGVGSTDQGCVEPPGVMEQETAYQSALSKAVTYQKSDSTLELMDEAGDVLLIFQAAGDSQGQLDATSWVLTRLQGEPLRDRTQITISFTDGWITGNSGCNNYGGEYMIMDGNGISIPGAAFEAMACTDPPGIMDQESTYRDAVHQAATYRISGTTLELMNEAGETVLVYERQ